MKTASDTADNQVCRAENGRFIAFWRGNVVNKFDGSLRYFMNEQAAWDFLSRRDGIGSSIVGVRRAAATRPVARD